MLIDYREQSEAGFISNWAKAITPSLKALTFQHTFARTKQHFRKNPSLFLSLYPFQVVHTVCSLAVARDSVSDPVPQVLSLKGPMA